MAVEAYRQEAFTVPSARAMTKMVARRSAWWWGVVVLTAAILMQIFGQAHDAGQVIRVLLLGEAPAIVFEGRWFELGYSSVLLVMLLAGAAVFGPARATQVRSERPIAYWTFFAGILLQGVHVAAHAAGIRRDADLFASAPIADRVLSPELLHFEINLIILVAVSVGFIAFRRTRQPVIAPTVTTLRAARARAGEAEALMNVGRLEIGGGSANVASATFLEALAAARAAGDHVRAARALNALGEISVVRGDPISALGFFREIVEIADDAAGLEDEGVERALEARRMLRAGDRAGAGVVLWRRVLETKLLEPESLAQALVEAARLAMSGKNDRQAAHLFGIVESVREAISAGLGGGPRAGERKVAGASLRTGYPEAWEQGRATPPVAAMRYALDGERTIAL